MLVLDTALSVAAVNVATEIIKRVGFPNRYLPLVALVAGLAVGLGSSLNLEGAIAGILYAGTAIGVYRGTKVVVKGA